MKKYLARFVVLAILLWSGLASAESLYQLSAGDTIRISVYGEDNLSLSEYKIDNRESLDYPYLGILKLGGKTLEEVQAEITQGLKGKYLVNPKVSVGIVQYRNIYINGLVNRPGGYEYEPGLTVQKAISLAGGVMSKYRRSAKAYHTKSTDSRKFTNLSQTELNKAFESDTQSEAPLYQVIKPGDTIYVVASFW